jgi:small conductance mechanosensitive channel
MWLLVMLVSCVLGTQQPTVAQNSTETQSDQNVLLQQLNDPELTDDRFTLRLLHLTNDELKDLANDWLLITREKVKQAADTNVALATASGPAAEQLREKLDRQIRTRNRLLRKMQLILNEWSAKGASDEAVAAYRRYAQAVLRSEFRATDLRSLLKFARGWIFSKDGGLRLLSWIGWLVASLFLMSVLARLLAGFLGRSLKRRSHLSMMLRDFISRTAYWIIFALGAALVLSSMGFNLTPLMAMFGGASFIVGFATQSTLGNLASGLLIMVSRPFDVGDQVDIAGVSGVVESVNTISTVIRDAANQKTIVPNKKVWDSVIVNSGANKSS